MERSTCLVARTSPSKPPLKASSQAIRMSRFLPLVMPSLMTCGCCRVTPTALKRCPATTFGSALPTSTAFSCSLPLGFCSHWESLLLRHAAARDQKPGSFFTSPFRWVKLHQYSLTLVLKVSSSLPQITAILLAIAGFVMIFAVSERAGQVPTHPHAIIGICLMFFTLIQPVNGIL